MRFQNHQLKANNILSLKQLLETIEKEAYIIVDTLFPGPFHTRGGSYNPIQTTAIREDKVDTSLIERANKYYRKVTD
jgi:hypothetical protein